MLGIDDPQIWLAYVSCVLSALGCMVYGALNWKGGEEEQTVKSSTSRAAVQDQ
ncbi:symporter small accessory protein [Methanosarcina sp. KYL-1]|uniref:symporter small accessory protein n=1 Tax=Methanosarcina sp. KYL-1 TaxID=2602068 RepID=UPI002100DF24|nr:symporter small accessory protein [Methanosarcina sp. KYL-1]